MDDSPRSSKRRKVDTPKRSSATSPATKPASTRKTPGRLTVRATPRTKGTSITPVSDRKAAAAAKPLGRVLKSATNGASTKQAITQDIDIYDDIEGALSVEPSPRPTLDRSRTYSREGTASSTEATDELQPNPTKRTRLPSAKAKAASQSGLRNVVNQKAAAEAESHDELGTDGPTPAKSARTARKPTTSTRKAPAPRSAGRRRKEATPEADEDTENQHNGINGTTPTKSRSTKKLSTRTKVQPPSDEEDTIAVTPSRSNKRRRPVKEQTTIQETEDELSIPLSLSAKKRTNGTKRLFNGVHHVNEQDEEHWSDKEPLEAGPDDNDDVDVDGPSLLESVLDPTEPSPFNKPNSTQKNRTAPALVYGNYEPGRHLDLLKTIIMERITGKRSSPLVGLEAEYKVVHQLIEHTITAGEGNSMLVIGARGSGKTALVSKVLSEVAKDNGGEYHVVRLNGFIHTDDKIALREIWRQLGKEMEIEEDGSGPGKNYADTLATLLALLSHPSEYTGEVDDKVAKAVVFIMDEFDLFAQHPRQTLLYNLFDIAQSRKAPIAVLGLTTRIDVTNSLEKRVKSRFSHRYVHLRLAKTFTEFQEVCRACLLVQPDHLTIEERGVLEGGSKSTPLKKAHKGSSTANLLTEWNSNINHLFSTPSFLTTHLAPTFYLTKCIPTILNSFLLPVSTLSPNTPLTPTPILRAPDSKLALIPHLSTLSLSLLIAATRLDIIHDTDTANFNMAYDEYVTLASRARIQSAAGGLSSSSSASKVWGKDVARREWEGLVDVGLVIPVVAGQVGAFGMVRADVSLEEVGEVLKGVKGGDKGLERWCRSL